MECPLETVQDAQPHQHDMLPRDYSNQPNGRKGNVQRQRQHTTPKDHNKQITKLGDTYMRTVAPDHDWKQRLHCASLLIIQGH